MGAIDRERPDFDMLFPTPIEEEQDMARRRFQRTGTLYRDGNYWRLRWYEDIVLEDGTVKRARPSTVVGLARGKLRITKKEAGRRAAEQLKEVNLIDRQPESLMRVSDFIARKFEPEHVMMLKPGGRVHYRVQLAHIESAIGKLALREVRREHIQQLCSDLLKKTYRRSKNGPEVPYSVQSAVHLKNAASALFEHAKACRLYPGENPARYVRLPQMKRAPRQALTADQVQQVLALLSSPARELAYMAVMTSMNIAELCGLQWKHVNLSRTKWIMVDGEPVPPRAIAVRRQWREGAEGTLKASARRRTLPVTAEMEKTLRELNGRGTFTGAEDPVFVSRRGTPVDAHNLSNRVLRPAGQKLGLRLGWHVFRHTHAALLRRERASPSDQMAMLGHSDIRTTMMYGGDDVDLRRTITARLDAALKRAARSAGRAAGRKPPAREEGPYNKKVIKPKTMKQRAAGAG